MPGSWCHDGGRNPRRRQAVDENHSISVQWEDMCERGAKSLTPVRDRAETLRAIASKIFRAELSQQGNRCTRDMNKGTAGNVRIWSS